MSNSALLLPVLVNLALLFFVLARMGMSRTKAVVSGKTKIRDIALSEQAWSDEVKKISNSYRNQLQLPLVFYACVLFFMVLARVDTVVVILAWAFVAARFWHAYIHLTSNHVPTRFRIFGIGIVVLIAMWVWLAVRVYFIG